MPSPAKLLASASGASTDPNFRNVTLLLHGDGSNGAQNNTFLDSSSNNFTVTRNGNTTQGSFSPYGTRWSNYFDGAGDFLSVPSSTAFDLGSSDFTIECWFNAASFAAAFGLASRYSAAPAGWFLRVINATTIRFYRADVASDITVPTMAVGTWYHVAAVRSGTTVTVYLNGSSVGSVTGVSNFTDATGTTVQIGRTHTITDDCNGYISDVRIVKAAVYTSAFAPPTAPLTAIANTSLLTCQSNRFRDASANNFAITRNGDTRVTPFSPYAPSSPYSAAVNGGSMYFDGNGDYLSAPNNAAFAFGTGDFTIETWIYLPAYGAGTNIVDTRNGDTSTGLDPYIDSAGGLGIYVKPTAYALTGATVPLNAWTHVAYVRSGTTVKGYVNGVGTSTATISTNFTDNGCRVGANINATPDCMTGLLADFRITKSAVYSANFTPPTAPLSAITNTQLLLKGQNAAIFDSAADNNLETVGTAQITTSVKKFGTGSIYIPTGSLFIPNSTELDFGSGNWTVEFWAYSDASGTKVYFDALNAANTTIQMEVYSSGTNLYWVKQGGTVAITANGALSANTWQHIAVAKSGSSTRLFVNGTQVGSTYTDNETYSSPRWEIGRVSGAFPINGYLDEFRVTKGVARYTANFTPPTAPFPDQ